VAVLPASGSKHQTWIVLPVDRFVSTVTTPDRCHACQLVTSYSSVHRIFCGDHGARSKRGSAPSLTRSAKSTSPPTYLLIILNSGPTLRTHSVRHSIELHLFETGGENYHGDFAAWDYQRGHEGDAWKTRPDASWVGSPSFGRGWTPYDDSRGWFRDEADFPGPHLIWPPYRVGAVEDGVISARDAQQIRACYGAKLSMIDHWFGKVLDALDAGSLWDDTAVIVTTDHGHYSEKTTFGESPERQHRLDPSDSLRSPLDRT
jgi:hypothetical protein